MTVPSEGVRRGRRKRDAGTSSAVFFLWVILILAQLSVIFAVRDESGASVESPARKVRFFETVYFHAPSSPAQLVGNGDDPADTLYGEDKRIIHTGPNPLHN
ncbi:hypothetical protein L1049_006259 [Liquidambar formosana]|uniref:Uncharacterized protein n=1 Tax=Liquidambar formosana TaxID=63359 RepID=A0AAP0RGW4_LIQFO